MKLNPWLQGALLLVVFLALHLALLAFCNVHYMKEIKPPKDARLGTFPTSDKNVCCIREIEMDGKTYTVVWGRFDTNFKTFFALPSGPPAYVFNADKTLVDWCSDTGDDTRFMKKWNHVGHDPLAHPREKP